MLNEENDIEEKEIRADLAAGSAPTPLEAEERAEEEAVDAAYAADIARDEAALENAEQTGATSAEVHTLKKKAVNSVFWRIGEVGGRQIIQLGISIVLARLILPESFGAVAMLTIFTAIANVFVDSGFSTAIIRKTDRTEADCNTVFWFNIAVALFFYGILFLCAPLIADFYDMPILKPVLRVSAIGIVIGSFAGLQRSLMVAEMHFKTLAKFSILSLVISGTVGMIMAYYDFQVWALVAQGLVSTIINTLFILWKSPWRPKLLFSTNSFKEFFAFGSKLLASGLLDTVYNNLRGVIIGKVYSASDLAFYNRSESIGMMTASTPTGVLQSVTYPTLCKMQHDDALLLTGYRRMIRLSAFIVFPLCLGASAVATPLVRVLFGEPWMFTAVLMHIMCFSMMWYPVHAINLNLLIVKGRSDLFFRLEVWKKVIGVISLLITVPISIEAMIYGAICTSVIALYLNSYYTGKLLGFGFLAQLRDMGQTLMLSLGMYVTVRILTHFLGTGGISLCAGIFAGIIFYAGGALLMRMPEVSEIKNIRK